MSAPKDDEGRIRAWLRNRVDGPPPPPAGPPPLVQVHIVPTPDPADDEDDQDDEPEQPRPWWHVVPAPFGARPDSATAQQPTTATAPGIHVTVNQPEPAAPSWTVPDPAAERAAERLHRRRIWLAYHAGAAAVGWVLGLVHLMADLLADAGQFAPAAGIAMGLVTWIVASYLPGLPYMPPALRPVMTWAARIPVCSAALALALHAPGTL
ncbi:hypothetical protein [Streptomyces cyaneofuscatus]|uniref:hypothetical protein n=1 Tax=Streptomyces cyaneofuscatus TaxID=66883 RepID=UPI00382E8CA4